MTHQTQLLGKYLLSGQIRCVTGLHVGGSTTGIEIGGLENPVIKDPLTDEPYIPGSGLKGKLRSITEWSLGLIDKHESHGTYAAYHCNELEAAQPPNSGDPGYVRYQNALTVGRLYGPANDKTEVRVVTGPSRLTVRDSFLTKESKDNLKSNLGLFTEVKTENSLDRVTSEANPRPIERVPAGSAFDFTLIMDIYQTTDRPDHELFRDLLAAMRLLEHSSLGGSGSRGHGQVVFEKMSLSWRPLEYYRAGAAEQEVSLPGESLESAVKDFGQIAWPA